MNTTCLLYTSAGGNGVLQDFLSHGIGGGGDGADAAAQLAVLVQRDEGAGLRLGHGSGQGSGKGGRTPGTHVRFQRQTGQLDII